MIVHEYEIEAARNRALKSLLLATDGIWFSILVLLPGILLGVSSGRASFLALVITGFLGYLVRWFGFVFDPARQHMPDPGLVASFKRDKWLLLFYLIGMAVEVWRTGRPLLDAVVSVTGVLLGYAANYAGQLERAKVRSDTSLQAK